MFKIIMHLIKQTFFKLCFNIFACIIIQSVPKTWEFSDEFDIVFGMN